MTDELDRLFPRSARQPRRATPVGTIGIPVRRPTDSEPAADQSWRDQANCIGVDPDLFFPGRGESWREAKAVCRGCVVRAECLAFGMTEKFGIYGGLSERERRRIRRSRRAS